MVQTEFIVSYFLVSGLIDIMASSLLFHLLCVFFS